MRTFLKVLAALGSLVVVAIVAVFFMTSGMTDTADGFFLSATSAEYEQAYSFLAEDFKNTTSKEELKSYMEEHSLSKFKEASWHSRSVNGGRGELAGSITTVDGGVVPVSLGFVKGEEGWKIYSISKPSAGLQEESPAAQMPSEREQIKLVRDSMHVFAVSVREGNMSKMHDHVSSLWQDQFSVGQFDDAFGSFYQFGDALLVLDEHTPQFSDAATVNDEGILILKGFYPTQPNKLHFEHKYIYEGLGWKLMGLNVNIN